MSVAVRWGPNPRHAAWEAAVLPLNYAAMVEILVERRRGGEGVVREVLGRMASEKNCSER